MLLHILISEAKMRGARRKQRFHGHSCVRTRHGCRERSAAADGSKCHALLLTEQRAGRAVASSVVGAA